MFTQTAPPGLLYHKPDTILNNEEYTSICTIYKIIFIVFGAAADECYFYDGHAHAHYMVL